MKVGVIGCGMMGSVIGTALKNKGHHVVFGVRNEESPNVKACKEKDPSAVFFSIEDAIKLSDVIFLAIPFAGSKERVVMHGDALLGKVIIDCSNPWPLEDFKDIFINEVLSPDKEYKDPDEPTPPPFSSLLSPGLSGGEEISKLLEGGRFVKAFNQTGMFNIMKSEYPAYNGLKQLMYISGNDKEANRIVKELASDLGFEAFLLGDMTHSGLLEDLAMLNAYAMIKSTDFNMSCGLMKR